MGEPVKHRVIYYVQHRFEEWVLLNDDGKVMDAGPLLKVYIGRSIHDIRRAKLVVRVDQMPEEPKPLVVI